MRRRPDVLIRRHIDIRFRKPTTVSARALAPLLRGETMTVRVAIGPAFFNRRIWGAPMHLFGRAVRVSLAAGLAASLLISPAVAGPASGPPAANAAAISHIRIDNFGQVNPVYFRGAQPEGRDYADLAAAGIKTVIDLQADGSAGEKALVERAGMGFHRIPMTTRTAPTAEQIDTFLRLVNEPANQPVYVHCAGGRHRTGIMTAIYRMSGEGWTSDKAFQEMKHYKFGADFLHPEFKHFVYAYQPSASQPAAKAATSTLHQ